MSGLLRICTAGSVDDGKSTLIGRLLYDSRGVYEDQIRRSRAASKSRTAGPIDFSLFTDGLKAEREQGITIDVAYRYFATARRKFILADTPGHEQYTATWPPARRPRTSRSCWSMPATAFAEQTRRHARIARLLGISSFVLAVNKMDLVGFDREVFDDICDGFRRDLLDGAALHAIPLSALHGDNVITHSERTPWFEGREPARVSWRRSKSIAVVAASRSGCPCSSSLRPDDDFRGYAGQIASGTIRPGDPVTVLAGGRTSKVKRIVTWDGDLDVAHRADVGDAGARRRDSTSAAATCSPAGPVDVGNRLFDARWCGWTSGRSIPARDVPPEAYDPHGDGAGRHGARAESDRRGHRLDVAADCV